MKVDQFPLEYFQLFRAALDKTIHIKCPSRSEAKRLRMTLYHFRKELLKSPQVDGELALTIPAAKLSVYGKTLSVSYQKEPDSAQRRISIVNGRDFAGGDVSKRLAARIPPLDPGDS